jgi:16S rRNA (cytosine1402-N4)-methyltransferase
MENQNLHKPVLLKEVLQYLEPKDGESYVDATFGAGGYSEAILACSKNKLYSFDRDPEARQFADKLSEKFGERFEFVESNFGAMSAELAQREVASVDGIVFDLGVSSMQLDNAERGFSFSKDAKLDMRMSKAGLSAYDVVNETEEDELANIIYKYGDERKSRQIARKIVREREKEKITSTLKLASIVNSVVGYSKKGKIDGATKTFQAIRIHVNDELGELKQGLNQAAELLKPGGKMVVVSFHSLEDRMVKEFFRTRSGAVNPTSRYLPESKNTQEIFTLLKNGAVKPSDEEIENNPRARSARLRVVVKK